VVDEFEKATAEEIAKRLQKEGIVERFNQKSGIFTLTRMSNDDCMYLDRKSRLCTIYDKRPDTCRNHPKIGPRPGIARTSPRWWGADSSPVRQASPLLQVLTFVDIL
jgi:Fe-S-cluster containining protein